MDATKQTDGAVAQVQPEHVDVADNGQTLAKRVLRKIDWRLIPLMFLTYNLNFMDKAILSSASVFGLREDNVHYHFLLLLNRPGSDHIAAPERPAILMGLQRLLLRILLLGVPYNIAHRSHTSRKVSRSNTFMWGIVVALTAVCSNYGGLVTVRFFLGVAEATITPAFMFITSTWCVSHIP